MLVNDLGISYKSYFSFDEFCEKEQIENDYDDGDDLGLEFEIILNEHPKFRHRLMIPSWYWECGKLRCGYFELAKQEVIVRGGVAYTDSPLVKIIDFDNDKKG